MEEQKNRMTNERDYKQVHGYTAPDKEKEELIKRLGEMITDRYAVKLTHSMQTDDPEYWALDEVLTKEEAKFMLSFGKTRVNYTAKELAKKNDMTEEEAQKIIDHLVWTGVVELNRENEDHHLQYNVPIFVPGSAEFMMMQGPLTEAHPNLASFFNLMTQMPLEGMTPMVPLGGAGVGMHVIPVEKAIETQNQSVSVEHLSHWLNKYDKYSIGLCTCRKQQEMRGEGDGEVPGDFCIGVGDMAEFCVTRNTGRYATYDEVMELLERAERHGFVHQITNVDGENKIVGICNCAPGVCNVQSVPRSFTTHRICHVRPIARMWIGQNVLPVASAWRFALSEQRSLDRSCAERTERRSHIRRRSFRMQPSGRRTTGTFITARTRRSTAMIRELHPVRVPVPRILRYRGM